jgi:hypothetical protein
MILRELTQRLARPTLTTVDVLGSVAAIVLLLIYVLQGGQL